MQPSKHTPGPWQVAEKNNGGSVIRGGDDVYVARCNQVQDMAANSALIAAAPDTYASLRAMTDWVKAALNCRDWHWDGDQREAAEIELATALEALAKAEGRS